MRKHNILVVDDTVANLRLLSTMLSEQGYKVRSVVNGPMALTAARSAPPDLILLDINLPDMNGYQVCQELKDDQRTHDIPVIFISALDETVDKVKAFAVGGVDYITKPFQFEEGGYQEVCLTLSPGDLVILTSDGVVEAKNTHNEMFGFECLEQAIAAGPTASAQAMLDHLLTEIETFTGDTEPHDDMTLALMRLEREK